MDPKKGDQLPTLLTAPSRDRASTAKPCQGWGPKPSSRAGQVRVTLLGQKGSLGKSAIGRAAPRNHGATNDPTAVPAALFFYRWGNKGFATWLRRTGDNKWPRLGHLALKNVEYLGLQLSLAALASLHPRLSVYGF